MVLMLRTIGVDAPHH